MRYYKKQDSLFSTLRNLDSTRSHLVKDTLINDKTLGDGNSHVENAILTKSKESVHSSCLKPSILNIRSP